MPLNDLVAAVQDARAQRERQLNQLRTQAQIAEDYPELFASEHSVKWFVRKHYLKLLDRGALVRVAGRLFVHEPSFQAVVLSIGRDEVLGSQRGRHSHEPPAPPAPADRAPAPRTRKSYGREP
jgi:hypothetical protein